MAEPPVDASMISATIEHHAPVPSQLQSSAVTPYCLHGVVPQTGPLNLAVAQLANVSLHQANDLIALGAVWARLETLTPEELVSLYNQDASNDDDNDTNNIPGLVSSSRALYADLQGRATSPGARRKRRDENDEDDEDEEGESLDDYIARMEQVRYRRVLSPTTVDAGTDVRIYHTPRRFTSACQQLTSDKLLYEDTTFLVVDKPPMLPTQPDASNYQECCPGCVSNALNGRLLTDVKGRNVERPLLCHRVDAVVGGCVVLSKDRHGQKVFAALQRDRKIRKVYLAITDTRVPLGQHVHWMWAPQTNVRGKRGGPPCQLVRHQPPESRRKAREFWSRCVLEVVESKPIRVYEEDGLAPVPSTTTSGGGPPFRYQSVIRLVTGRKHQVRAQLASLGCPIWRDTLYGPMAGLTLDDLEPTTTASSSSSQDDEPVPSSREDQLDQALQQCRVPTEPIGLQAHAIAFGGVTAVARPPWWSSRAVSRAGSTSRRRESNTGSD